MASITSVRFLGRRQNKLPCIGDGEAATALLDQSPSLVGGGLQSSHLINRAKAGGGSMLQNSRLGYGG